MKTHSSGNLAKLLAIVLAILSLSTAWSCPSPTRPGSDSKYVTIVLAEVTGVCLTDYADARQRQIRQGSANAWASECRVQGMR